MTDNDVEAVVGRGANAVLKCRTHPGFNKVEDGPWNIDHDLAMATAAYSALRPGDPLPDGNVVNKSLTNMNDDEFMTHYRSVQREFTNRMTRAKPATADETPS